MTLDNIRGALRAGVMAACCALPLSRAALAQDADAPPSKGGDVSFGLRGVGEVWQDQNIITHYRSSRFAGAGFAGVGLSDRFELALELGYMRQAADTSMSGVASGSLELLPVTVGVNVRRDGQRAELFAGGGLSAVVFTERTTAGTVSGAKPCVDLRAGTRIHTGLVQPSPLGDASTGVRRLDVELLVGRRQHHAFGLGTGFDLSAWRVGVGLVARL